jgi:transposase
MGQRSRILTQIAGVRGFKVVAWRWEAKDGGVVFPIGGFDVAPSDRLVLTLERRFVARCAKCPAFGLHCHERLPLRRWQDLPMGTHPVTLEYAPIRVDCRRCGARAVEELGFAEPHQRQTRRLQQHVALDAFSMPLMHVATKYAMSWHSVRRAETAAIARWEATRTRPALKQFGLDEKWLGRRHKGEHKFVTIVSDLLTGEPVWMGYGRDEATVAKWLATLTDEQKAQLTLCASDMHRPYFNAIRADTKLAHVVYTHDPFHVIKRAGEALSELRRSIFFRAGEEMRTIGRGTRWLVLRAWENSSEDQRARLREIFALNLHFAPSTRSTRAR